MSKVGVALFHLEGARGWPGARRLAFMIDYLGTSATLAAIGLTTMLGAGAVGTLTGSRCADRWGRRLILVWAMLPLSLLLALPIFALLALAFAVPLPSPVSPGAQREPRRGERLTARA